MDARNAASSSSSPSSSSSTRKYQVFLSFRGEDKRKGFTGHLHAALSDAGIRAFLGDNELERAEFIKKPTGAGNPRVHDLNFIYLLVNASSLCVISPGRRGTGCNLIIMG
ncbi:unnamed protein product [Prunus armeniaca]